MYPPAYPHDTLTTLYPNVYLLHGSIKMGMNIGGPWLNRVTPKGGSLKQDFEQLLQLDFDAVIAAHGVLIDKHAKELLQQEVMERFGVL